MTVKKLVHVTPSDVQSARLELATNKKLGKESPGWLVRLANAEEGPEETRDPEPVRSVRWDSQRLVRTPTDHRVDLIWTDDNGLSLQFEVKQTDDDGPVI